MARGSSRHFYVLNDKGELEEAYGIGIAEARKRNAFISPTSVTKEVRSTPFQLVRWLRQQLVIACMESPCFEGEELDSYYDRVDQLSDRRSKEATDFGTSLHDAIEKYPQKAENPIFQPWWQHFDDWYRRNVDCDLGIEEKVFDPSIGVAGKLDRRVVLKDGRMAILDIKSQGIKDRVYYGEDWPKQLSFYANAVKRKHGLPTVPVCMNLVMDRNAPSPVIPKEWSQTDIEEAHHEFVIDAYLWQLKANHWPSGRWYLVRSNSS